MRGFLSKMLDTANARRVAEEAARAAERTARAFAAADTERAALSRKYAAFQQRVLEMLACPICLERLGDGGPAVETSCGHAFCAGCLLEVLSHQGAERGRPRCECPVCRAAVSSVHPSFALRALVESERAAAQADGACAGGAAAAPGGPQGGADLERRLNEAVRSRQGPSARAPSAPPASAPPAPAPAAAAPSAPPAAPVAPPPARAHSAVGGAGEMAEARDELGRWVRTHVLGLDCSLRTPLDALAILLRAILVLGLYVAMPFDLIPDGIPVVGQIDDYVASALALLLALVAAGLVTVLLAEEVKHVQRAVERRPPSARPALEPGRALALALAAAVYGSRRAGVHFLPPGRLPGLAAADDAAAAALLLYGLLAAACPPAALALELGAARALAAARRSPLAAALCAAVATSLLAARALPATLDAAL